MRCTFFVPSVSVRELDCSSIWSQLTSREMTDLFESWWKKEKRRECSRFTSCGSPPRTQYSTSSMEGASTFQHEIAQRLATSLNLGEANETLAARVIGLARSLPSEAAFIKAAATFGKFSPEFLAEIRSDIQSRGIGAEEVSNLNNGSISYKTASSQIKIESSEVLQPEGPSRAGLMTAGEVSQPSIFLKGYEQQLMLSFTLASL